MVRLHKPFLEPLGLTFPQYLVILELLNGAPLSVGALGARLDMDTGTITPLLKRLDAAGMVTRTRDPADERRVRVDLTPRGPSKPRSGASPTGSRPPASLPSRAWTTSVARSKRSPTRRAREAFKDHKENQS